MKLLKVAAAVLNQTPLDWEANKANMLGAIEAARGSGVHLLCLPELCVTGYGCEDAFHAPGVAETALRVLSEIVPATERMVVSVGLPVRHRGSLFNAACLIADRRIAGFAAKQNLAGEGIHYEPRWFKPWPAGAQVELEWGSRRYPLGDLVFSCDGVLIGFEICEDAWVAQRRGGGLARAGVDLILNPSASHFAFGKHAIRQRFVLEGSRAFQVSYVYANLLGNEAGRAIYDGDAMIASGGRMLASGPRFSYADYQLTTAVIDVDHTRMQRVRTGGVSADIGGAGCRCVEVPHTFPRTAPEAEAAMAAEPAWERSAFLKEEEFTRAVALGLFDYLRKSGAQGFVVSLSGGVDSSAVACLSALLVHFGVQELGHARFRKKLAHIPALAAAAPDAPLVREILTCVYQSTRNSTLATQDAARAVAAAVGAQFCVFDVDPVVQQYVSIVSRALGRELTWQTDDLALQNIQARTRSPSAWMLANLREALLLSTSNRSEAAVGYATMDGDTAGGLAPIAGIDKAFLRDWLRWLEQRGPDGAGPIPALAQVNRLSPTAELRPPASQQTDEDDLMPYVVLDAIERAAIRDKLMPVEVLSRLESAFRGLYDRAQLGVWIDRFFRLWSRNQWKRERYAPSFHLDDENLDPKTWCRFPILSGGFARELRELKDCLARP